MYVNISAYQNANVAADRAIMLNTNGPAIESASLCTGASRDWASSTYISPDNAVIL